MPFPTLAVPSVSKLFLSFVATLALTATLPLRAADEAKPAYLDASVPLETRVEDLLKRLTIEEKISLLHGDSKFTTAAIPRLGIPRRWLSDGPHGVREDIGPDTWQPAGRTDDFATAMPCGIALSATWNPELAQATGITIAEEARARGKHIMLGPAVNIMRTPLCGRNFEYMGEDPWLTSRMAVGYIRGQQSQEIASCVKHFAVNNQETERNSINVEVDERVLREIYLPAFEASVKEAHVWSVMGAYNKLRGEFCCQNDYLLNQILKKEWAFNGLVMSDWNAAHNTKGVALGGLDLEMGTERKAYADFYLAKPFREAIEKGEIPQAVLDDKVRRNLRVMLATHILDGRAPGSMNTKTHQDTSRHVAEEAMVLLKNDGALLPLDATKLTSIAVIGENATRLQCHGGQSSEIKAFYEITPLDGLVRRAGGRVNITYAVGYASPPAGPRSTRSAAFGPEATAAELADRAVAAAKAADVVIFVGGLNHDQNYDSESWDRKDLKLPYGQDELLARVLAANPRTVVVLVAGSPVEMPWIAKAPAVLQAWYGGMEAGNALARVLFGDVNPSGKLPCTFPQKLADSPAHALDAYPGKEGTVRYVEGLLVGYRWFDTKEIAPLFPFGHGLSYTTFGYANLRATTADAMTTVQVDLTNTGTRDGTEVVQLYVEPVKPTVERPKRELKAFAKVALKAGEKKTVTLTLPQRAFAHYDTEKHAWLADAGEYVLRAGSSSRDLRVDGRVVLANTVTAD